MIEQLYDTTVQVIRSTTANPTGGDSIATIGSYLGVFRVESEPDKLLVGNNISKEFDFYTQDDADILIGDSLIDGGGDTYKVHAVSVFEGLRSTNNSHLKARCFKK